MVQHQAGLQCTQLQTQPLGALRLGLPGAADAQHQAAVGRLFQRCWQVDRDAGQVAGHLPFGLTVVQADQGLVGGLALQALAPTCCQGRLGQTAQPVGAGAARQAKAQAAVRLAAAVNLYLAARKLAAQPHHLQALVGGLDLAPRVGQRWQLWPQPQVIAQQLHAGLDDGIARVGQRDVEAQLELGAAAGAGLGQGVAGPTAHGCGVEVAQQVGQGATRLALDLQQGLVRQLADAALHLAQLYPPEPAARTAELHRIALEQQLAADAGERGPVGRAARRRLGQGGGDRLCPA